MFGMGIEGLSLQRIMDGKYFICLFTIVFYLLCS